MMQVVHVGYVCRDEQ